MSIKSIWQSLRDRLAGRSSVSPKVGIFYLGEGAKADGVTLVPAGLENHTLVLGTTGRGRSYRLMEEAKRLGITYDELIKRLEPSEEEKAARQAREDALRKRELARLDAMREVYWAATAVDDSLDDFDWSEVLAEHVGIELATPQQQKALFFMLPADIVGNGISWGFSDTEVRDSIWRFVEENKAEVAAAIMK